MPAKLDLAGRGFGVMNGGHGERVATGANVDRGGEFFFQAELFINGGRGLLSARAGEGGPKPGDQGADADPANDDPAIADALWQGLRDLVHKDGEQNE